MRTPAARIKDHARALGFALVGVARAAEADGFARLREWLDARKCSSYLTIELRTHVPEELRPGVGDWLFGCDVCQEVCPWNRKDASRPEAVNAAEILSLTDEEFRRRYKGTALE